MIMTVLLVVVVLAVVVPLAIMSPSFLAALLSRAVKNKKQIFLMAILAIEGIGIEALLVNYLLVDGGGLFFILVIFVVTKINMLLAAVMLLATKK